jgi:hypothetical protein
MTRPHNAIRIPAGCWPRTTNAFTAHAACSVRWWSAWRRWLRAACSQCAKCTTALSTCCCAARSALAPVATSQCQLRHHFVPPERSERRRTPTERGVPKQHLKCGPGVLDLTWRGHCCWRRCGITQASCGPVPRHRWGSVGHLPRTMALASARAHSQRSVGLPTAPRTWGLITPAGWKRAPPAATT